MVDTQYNADEVMIGLSGNLLIAPGGTALPATYAAAVTAMDAGTFVDLGYISVEGASFSYTKETQDINAWQTPDPIRTIVTARKGTIQASLMQVDEDVVKYAFGGGVWAQHASGVYEYEFPTTAPSPENALLWHIEDGTKHMVMAFYRSQVSGDTTLAAQRDGAMVFPVTISLLADPTAGNIGRIVGVVPLGS